MAADDGVIIHRYQKFEHIKYTGKHLKERVFEHCTFYKCHIQECLFEDSMFDKCVFEDCDLSLMKFTSTSFRGVSLLHCKAIGISWSELDNPLHIEFEQSRISFGTFYNKNLKKTKFINCIADEVDFSECNLTQADFRGTELRNATFANTDLTKANFVGATNYLINQKTNKITGARFSLPEALSFLYALNIELVDDEEQPGEPA